MSHSEPPRSSIRRARPITLAAVVIASTMLVTIVGCQPSGQPQTDHPQHPSTPLTPWSAARGEADGALPGGVTVFDDEYPGIAKLDTDLLEALREAATAADDDGVEFIVNSGWRSPEYQDRLLREAISDYGSEDVASQWVATPDTSFHVTGDAVDLDAAARAWLSEHGATYGLCQIYRNEPWHYELRPDAMDHRCPAMYADPSHDPRLQQ